MQARLTKIGNSKGIIFPKVLLSALKIEDEVSVEIKDKIFVIKAVKIGPRANWESQYEQALNAKNVEEPPISFTNKFDEEEWQW